MESVILQMFNKERGHYESVPLNEAYQEQADKLAALEEELREKLKGNPDLVALYEKVSEAFFAVASAVGDSHYVEGFKFGVLMGLEIAGTR